MTLAPVRSMISGLGLAKFLRLPQLSLGALPPQVKQEKILKFLRAMDINHAEVLFRGIRNKALSPFWRHGTDYPAHRAVYAYDAGDLLDFRFCLNEDPFSRDYLLVFGKSCFRRDVLESDYWHLEPGKAWREAILYAIDLKRGRVAAKPDTLNGYLR